MITANVLRFVVTSIATIFRTSDCIDSKRFLFVQSNFYRCFRQIAAIDLEALGFRTETDHVWVNKMLNNPLSFERWSQTVWNDDRPSN